MMMATAYLGGALSALRAKPLRSLLTILGLAVGVASLIGLAGIGEGFSSAVSDEMAALGTRLLMVEPRSPKQDHRADRKLPTTLTAFDAVAVSAVYGVSGAVPLLLGEQLALGPTGNSRIAVIGSQPSFGTALHFRLRSGRWLTDSDDTTIAKVIVLGSRTAAALLGADADSAISEGRAELKVGSTLVKVVGILQATGSLGGWNIDDAGFVPLTTARLRLFGADRNAPNKVDALLIDLADPPAKSAIAADVRRTLREQHRIAPQDSNDFAVTDLAASARTESAIMRTIRIFLAVTAATTMLVGGVGIANIMMVAVSERSGEIGLLQALGARRHDILVQFVVEAAMLALIGGLAGAGLGVGLGAMAAQASGLQFGIDPGIVTVAPFGAALVGLLSGLYPAHQAARLSPLEALRRPG